MGARLLQFKVETYPQVQVIGKGITLVEGEMKEEDTPIEDLWASMVVDGSLALLDSLPGHVGAPGDVVGWMGDFFPPDMHFTYLAGALFGMEVEPPEGFIARVIETGQMAISSLQETEGEVSGEDNFPGSIHSDASAINNQQMAKHGYEYDGSRGLFEMEYQSYERYSLPLERGEPPTLEFISPCKLIDPETSSS